MATLVAQHDLYLRRPMRAHYRCCALSHHSSAAGRIITAMAGAAPDRLGCELWVSLGLWRRAGVGAWVRARARARLGVGVVALDEGLVLGEGGGWSGGSRPA